MALSQLPKSFGLKELKMGYFPHLYNKPEHEQDFDKVLPNLLNIHVYDVHNMRDGARAKFMDIHRDNHSKEAIEWILWFQHTYENVLMKHATSADGERHIQYDVKATLCSRWVLCG